MNCEVTKYGKPCTSAVYCLFRRRVFESGKWAYRNMYVCETHAKNHDRTNDTYDMLLIGTNGKLNAYSGEASPYWNHYEKHRDEQEDSRANPDGLGDTSPNPWKSEELSFENEELIRKVKDSLDILSFREGQILNLMCYRNMSQAQIAVFLNIKPQAVSNYIKRIKKKMQSFV